MVTLKFASTRRVLLLPAPARRSHAEKDALIAALTARLALADESIAAQDARIAALEARLQPTGPAAEDPRQFIEAALARTEGGPLGTFRRSPAAAKPPRCRADAASEPRSHDRTIARSHDRTIARSHDRTIARSHDRPAG